MSLSLIRVRLAAQSNSSFNIASVGMQDHEEQFRRNRDQFSVELRKENREATFKRRRGNLPEKNMENEVNNQRPLKLVVDPVNQALIEQIMQQTFDLSQVDQLCAQLSHPDLAFKHRAVIGLRIIVSKEENFELMQRIIDAGCVPILIQFMKQSQYPQLQLEATWILTNIACGRTSQCQSIIDKNGLEAFFQVISENKPHIAEQAVWGLGNIAGDNPKLRDTILQKGGLEVLMKTVESSTSKAMIEQGSWAISNLCRGTPRPKYSQVKSAIPMLVKLVMSEVLKDEQIGNCLWAIAANSQTQKTRIQQIVEIKGFVQALFELCRKKQGADVLAPTLRVIGNISNGNEIHTEELLRAGCLQVFTALLDYPKKSIKREVCWIISNICVGTASQLNQILGSQELLGKLFILLQGGEPEVKKEVCYIFGNMCHCGKPESILNLMHEYHILESLMACLMSEQEGKCLEGGLHALFETLKLGEKLGKPNVIYTRLEEEMGFFERLEDLQKHPSQEVYQKLIRIFESFFSSESSFV